MATMFPMTPITPLEGDVEMFTRSKIEPLFSLDTALAHRNSMLSVVPEVDSPATLLEVPRESYSMDKMRPMSEITEIFDELDDIEDELSEFEEDSVEEVFSFQSNEGRRSQSTLSSFDEVPTPRSSKPLPFAQNEARRSVEGPRGPHLFRASNASELSFDFALQLSPVVSKKQELRIDTAFTESFPNATPTTIAEVPATFVSEDEWNKNEPETWSADQVSLWMYHLGVEDAVIEKFEHNDITGRVLLDLQFNDLKDIGIESFGKRHELWSQICSLRDGEGGISPVPTPFQDTSPRHSQGSRCSHRCSGDHCEDSSSPKVRPRRRKYRANPNDPITPMDSVSIVAIEQLVPRPHKCEKGENCSKWKKQQKLFKRLNEDHGLPISPENGGQIWMSGDPGNFLTAPNIVENAYRPISEAVPSVVGPSVVASSDLLGPGDMPPIALQADSLKQIQERDAQENVKTFLSLQHVEPPAMLEPASPLPAFGEERFEMFPSQHVTPAFTVPLTALQGLPRLQIPRSNTTVPVYENNANLSAIQDPFSAMSHRTSVASSGIYRFGTPASEMDVAITFVPTGPVARDTSQSVPPNMVYRDPVRNSRQDWRRPSCALPSLNENEVFSPTAHSEGASRRASQQTFGSNDLSALKQEVKMASPVDYKKKLDPRYPGVNHAGWMKKRKTKLLRHEWNEHHFRLTGNQLKMHQNDIPQAAILESLNIDEYAVACSSIASNKLAAKFKALKIAKDKDTLKDSAFEFQLVPDQMSRSSKSHHFAVKSRDERIDWMRELMLAKALRAKKEGLVVEVNGKEV